MSMLELLVGIPLSTYFSVKLGVLAFYRARYSFYKRYGKLKEV